MQINIPSKLKKIIMIIIPILIIILSIILIFRLQSPKKIEKTSTTPKEKEIVLTDLNFLKNEANSYIDFYCIKVVTPDLFLVKNPSNDNYSLIDKNNNVKENNYQYYKTYYYPKAFINANISNTNTINNFQIYDLNGNKILEDEEGILLNNSLLFIGDSFSQTGKIYNLETQKLSNELTIYQVVGNLLLVKEGNEIKVIDKDFKLVKALNKENYLLLNDTYLYNSKDKELLNYQKDKKTKGTYDNYYPLYNEFVEVCNQKQCGILNMDTNKLIVPLEYEDLFVNLEYNDITTNNRSFYYQDGLFVIEEKAIYNTQGKLLFNLDLESYLSTIDNKNAYLLEQYPNEKEKKITIFNQEKDIFLEKILSTFTIESSSFNGYIAYKDNETKKYGISDLNDKKIVDFDYDDIDLYSKVYVVTKDNKQAIYDYQNKEILAMGNYNIEWQLTNDNIEILLIENKANHSITMLLMNN